MQTIAPPKISPETIAAFFASMRLWLLEALAPFLLYVSDRTSNGREIRAWLDAEVRDAIDETKRMLFVMAVARMAPKRVYATRRGGARPCTTHKGFRLAPPRSRKWFRLTTRALKARGRGLRGRLALLRDLIARPDHWAARICVRVKRLHRSRKGARFLCVAPPALILFCTAPAPEPACADTS